LRARDLVGEQQVREDRAELGLELAAVLLIDRVPVSQRTRSA